MADFRKMQAWQKADDLAVLVYQTTKAFPADKRFGLTSQMRRAAVSIPANIAEGSGKQTLKDFQRFLHIARGSLSEVEYYIHLSARLEYLSKEQSETLQTLQQETGAILNGLIRWTQQEMDSGQVKL